MAGPTKNEKWQVEKLHVSVAWVRSFMLGIGLLQKELKMTGVLTIGFKLCFTEMHL